jgi:alanine racemase
MLTLRKLFSKTYHPLNEIIISKDALLSNYQYLCSINSDIKVAPVLKSNAYGHGLKEIASVLDSLDAPFFCVDSLYEGYNLLKAGIKTKILVLGFSDSRNLEVKRLPFSYAAFDVAQI